MSSARIPPPSSASLLAAWRQRAELAPGQTALRLHRHGVWRSLSWAQFSRLVEDSRRVWQSLGITAGAQVALVGPVSEVALASVLGLALLGARAVLMPQGRPDAMLVDGGPDLAELNERDWPAVLLVREGEGVVTGNDARLQVLDQVLRRLGEPAPGDQALGAAQASETLLLSGLQSDQALLAVLQLWLSRPVVLALPEPRGDVHLARRALQPTWVLDTAQGHAQWLNHVASRWPQAQSWRARILAAAFAASARQAAQVGIKAWLRQRVLHQLGLARTRGLLSDGEPDVHVAEGLGRLGLRAESDSASWLAADGVPPGSPGSHRLALDLAALGGEHAADEAQEANEGEIHALRRAAS